MLQNIKEGEMTEKCPHCQAEISSDSEACSECGTRFGTVPAATQTFKTSAIDASAGEVISDKYKLIEEIGSGGMGIVYKAEQIQPVKRIVALKIIKLGMDTKQVVARFKAERQTLAMMDHPNIAKVFDGGATEKGRPYFVMELVRGIPITHYCDKYKLSTRERLELFIDVCQAVQHAHQKGVIHRDLKPSNILVEVHEEKVLPRIIDFGIAKATEHRLAEQTLFTMQGQLIGTPEYMSPEQAEMSGLDVDSRTDIYSLGVILYELMVGVLPFDPETLRRASIGEIQRIIREKEPPKASTRLSSLSDTQTEVVERRKTDLNSLLRELRGDLDWVAVKAMAKDRTRRYASASELAADIERNLKHEAVLAGPPSRIYRIKKYIRRHRLGMAAAAVMMIAILGGIAGTGIGLLKATRAEKRAIEEAKAAQAVSDFLVDLFEVSDPGEARGNTITAREILDEGAKKITEELSDQPEIQARLLVSLGNVYRRLGLFPQAQPLIKQSLEIRRRTLGDDHLDTINSISTLSVLLYAQGKYPEAEIFFREVLEFRRRELGIDNELTLATLNNLGGALWSQGKEVQAEKYFREALEGSRRLHGNEDKELLIPLNSVGGVLWGQGKYEEAEGYYREALNIGRKHLGNDHPNTLLVLNNLGLVLMAQQKLNEAEICVREALELKRKILGNDHPDTFESMSVMGEILMKQDKIAEAENYIRRALEGKMRTLGPDHLRTLESLENMARIQRELGNLGEAERHFRACLESRRRQLAKDHHFIAESLINLGQVFMLQKRHRDAESLLREALEIYRQPVHTESGRIYSGMYALGECLLDQRRFEEAESYILESNRGYMESPYSSLEDKIDSLVLAVRLYNEWNRPARAAAFQTELDDLKNRQMP
jgi:non-specific serine/threonine protein kinase/serine/threonine-protein kinase